MKPNKQASPRSPQGKAVNQRDTLPREEAAQLVSLFNAGRYIELETRSRLLVLVHPASGLAWKILGTALVVQGKDGMEALLRAAALLPQDAEVHCNLGNAQRLAKQPEQALASYRCALALKPELADAHFNVGIALRDLNRSEEAIGNYRRAIELRPQLIGAHRNLGIALQDLGRLEEAVACYRQALAIQPADTESLSNLLFTENYLPDVADDVLVADTRRYGEIVANKARPYQAWSNTPDANRPLRIGLVSGDFCNHPVGHFLEGVLSALHAQATGRLHLLAYATVARSDAVTNRLKAYCQVWRDVSALPDQHLAERIRADEVDILIDLSGHSAFNRLPMFAWKPAPVQATWLGYFASTGVAAIDYFLADPWSLPDGGASAFTEQIWCLPETRFCFTPPSERAPVSSLPAASNGHITFGCFNNLRKMNDSVVALWAQVLQQVAGSRLHLKAIQLDDEAVRQEVIRRFAAHGIAADRLSLAGPSPRAEYLQAYHQVDIALDPFPFTGGTTTAESLWMGVPVLTMAGRHLVSRQGLGLLMNAGLPGWVATDPQDYVDKAIAYAADLQALSTLRAGLRKQVLASPVFDAPRFAVAFEAALREMWVRWCAGRAQAF